MVLVGKSTWRKGQKHREEAAQNPPELDPADPERLGVLLDQLRAHQQGARRRRAHPAADRGSDQGAHPPRRPA